MVEWATVLSVYRESTPALLISLLGGLFAGTVLGSDRMVQGFARFPGLLLLLPAFLATRGNVYGALGARIATGIHQGLVPPRFERDRRLIAAVTASFVNGIGISVIVGLLSWLVLTALPGREPAALLELVAITFVAGLLTSVVLISCLLALIFAGYRRGMDPDNLVGPLVTTLGDVFGVVFLYVAILLVDALL